MTDEVATIADIDKGAATVNVAPTNVPAEAPAPAAESAPTASVAVQTEAQDGAEPETKQEPSEGTPEWFKKRLDTVTRQRRNEERRADKLAARLEALERASQSKPEPKAQELRPENFPNYDAFHAARTEQVARETVRAEIEAATKTSAEQEAARASQSARETFLEKAQAQAEAADIDLDAVLETLQAQPLLSHTVAEHLAKSEQPARLAEYLALNPGKLHDVSMMGPALARKELAKMEVGLVPAASKPPATKAPPPGPTVGGRGIAQKSVDKMGMDEFAEHFMASEEARLKRM